MEATNISVEIVLATGVFSNNPLPPSSRRKGDEGLRQYSVFELELIARALMILHYVLSGRDSLKCLELAQHFSSELSSLKRYGNSYQEDE